MLVSSASGFVWSMNCASWLPPKNSFIAATTGRMLMSAFGRGLVDLLDRHALPDDALHAQQADPERVLDQLAVGADAAVAEVVDVVLGMAAAVALDQVADDGRDVLARDRPLVDGQLDAHPLGDAGELLVELVATDATEVVAAEVEEEALDELAGVVTGWRIARAQLLVDLDQGFLLRVGDVLVQRVAEVRVLGIGVDRAVEAANLLVVLVADGAQQRGGRDLALAVHLDPELVLVVRLELEPGAAVRDHLGREQAPAARGILELAVVDARGADQLADHDPLGAVDDERALVGHRREVAHVDALALDLAGLLDQELDVDVQRPAEREVLGPALELGVLGRSELVVQELELHHLAGEVLDRADLVEQLAQALVHEPLEGIELELDQVRNRQDLRDARIANAASGDGQAIRRLSGRQHESLLGEGRGEGPRSQNGVGTPRTRNVKRGGCVRNCPSRTWGSFTFAVCDGRIGRSVTGLRAGPSAGTLRRHSPSDPFAPGDRNLPPRPVGLPTMSCNCGLRLVSRPLGLSSYTPRTELAVHGAAWQESCTGCAKLPRRTAVGARTCTACKGPQPRNGPAAIPWFGPPPESSVAIPAPAGSIRAYLISTLAPCSSSAALIFSASSRVTPSLTGFGDASTRSLASLRPRPVSSRTTLMTGILFGPISTRTALNSVCSSTTGASAAGAAPPPCRRRRCDGCRGDAVPLLEGLDELRELEHGHRVDRLEQLVLGQCCHWLELLVGSCRLGRLEDSVVSEGDAVRPARRLSPARLPSDRRAAAARRPGSAGWPTAARRGSRPAR